MNKIYLTAIVSVTSFIIFSAVYILYEKEGPMPVPDGKWESRTIYIPINEEQNRKESCFSHSKTNVWNDTTKTCNLRFLPDGERILN